MKPQKAPRPTKVVGPKERANLKKTAGPGRPKATRKERQDLAKFRDFGGRVLADPAVRRAIWNRLRGPKPDPMLLRWLGDYVLGKAADSLELKAGPEVVNIIHKLRGDKSE